MMSVRIVAVWLLSALLVACVSNPAEKVRQEKAVMNRVVAATEYMQMGNPNEARRHLLRALELDGRSPEVHNAMSLLYKYEGDAEREGKHLQKALRADSSFGAAQNNYGTFLLQRGDLDGAVKYYSRAAENAKYSGRASAYQNLGRAYMAQNRSQEAIQVFNKSLRLDPAALQPLLELADVHFKDKKFALAERYYERYAREANPQNSRGLWLGIQLADVAGKTDRRDGYELALKNLYPNSREFRAWQAWLKGKEGA